MKKHSLLFCSLFLICVSSAFAADTLKIGINDEELTSLFNDKSVSAFVKYFTFVETEEEALKSLNDKTLDVVVSLDAFENVVGFEYAKLGEEVRMYWKVSSDRDADIRTLYTSLCAVETVKCPDKSE